MADNDLREFHKQHRIGQDRYTYFLLAVTASAVAFAVQKTSGAIMTYSLLPLGVAVLLWGLSFYFGCQNIIWVQAAMLSNYAMLQLSKGVHHNQPDHPQELKGAMEGVRSALESKISEAQSYAIWQFRFLLTGAGFFIAWHILEMVIRTYAHNIGS